MTYNDNNLISLIIPVYNVEPCLRKSIDTALNQTYQNFGLILVDDDSTDNSGKICDKYALKYKRIKVIHQKKQFKSIPLYNIERFFISMKL